MIITLCCSAKFYDNLINIKNELEELGYTVLTPSIEFRGQSAELKIENDLIMKHFKRIEKCDAIYVANYDKNGLRGYIGGNTLIEMGLAYYLRKKIYMLNEAPEMDYKDEIIALQPQVIGTNWNLINPKSL